ncbi:MAG TPA: 3-hydroxybutyryl-CoA dehydrogenase [Solirubrobacterales bacterium]|jgi:3-hydroxybutyryl-CoA dehydrogenase
MATTPETTEAEKEAARELTRLAVVGGGFMGSGIAESAAVAGLDVLVREPDEAALERARERLEASVRKGAKRGKIDDPDGVLGRVRYVTEPDALREAEVIIEAVPEDPDLKRSVFAELAELARADAILASNTSSIPIAELAAATPCPDRVVGLHFFSPVPVMKLVEVVVALETSPETVAKARAVAERLGKTPIQTKDRSGFVVNMLLIPYLMAAVRMYEEGFASREDIDTGMTLGCGHPMGPLALCDLIGLDVLYAVGNSLYEEFKRDEYAPPPLVKRMVAAGRLGRKSGRGFYEYS